jgi:hypothetical protein
MDTKTCQDVDFYLICFVWRHMRPEPDSYALCPKTIFAPKLEVGTKLGRPFQTPPCALRVRLFAPGDRNRTLRFVGNTAARSRLGQLTSPRTANRYDKEPLDRSRPLPISGKGFFSW